MAPNPYAPPGSAAEHHSSSAFAPPGWRTTATQATVVMATVFGLAMETAVMSGAIRSLPLGGVPIVGFFGAVVVAAILHGVWVARVARNLRALGRTGLRFPQFLAVASLYIPVVNLVLPIGVTTELWRASEPGAQADDWRRKSSKWGFLRVVTWWGAWNVAVASIWTSLGPYPYGEFPLAALVGCASLLVSCVAGIRVLGGIDARQQQAASVLTVAG